MQIFLLNFLMLPAAITFPQFKQSDYIIVSERMDVVDCCKEKYMTVKIHTFKYNRSHTGINMSFSINQDIGYHLKVAVQAYKFASNEYRLFPITYTADICDAMENNDFGLENIYGCGNAPRCPLKKGKYLICNWGPDYVKFPPHIPTGRYRINLKYIYMDEELHTVRWYIEVKSTKFLFGY